MTWVYYLSYETNNMMIYGPERPWAWLDTLKNKGLVANLIEILK